MRLRLVVRLQPHWGHSGKQTQNIIGLGQHTQAVASVRLSTVVPDVASKITLTFDSSAGGVQNPSRGAVKTDPPPILAMRARAPKAAEGAAQAP